MSAKYKIFLDDERFPAKDSGDWLICRNIREFKAQVLANGAPQYISFDHDLGENEPTGLDCLKWLIEEDLNCDGELLKHFKESDFYVHSQNPVGKKNIESYFYGYLKQR